MTAGVPKDTGDQFPLDRSNHSIVHLILAGTQHPLDPAHNVQLGWMSSSFVDQHRHLRAADDQRRGAYRTCRGGQQHDRFVRDARRAIDFWQRAFGARDVEIMTSPDGRVVHAELVIGDSRLMLGEDSGGLIE